MFELKLRDKFNELTGKLKPAQDLTPFATEQVPVRPSEEVLTDGVDARLGSVRFLVDATPHITVDNSVCQDCSTHACVYACPANLFTLLSDGSILFNYEQCFECGTCYVACNREGAISWSYPRGGFGVSFREA